MNRKSISIAIVVAALSAGATAFADSIVQVSESAFQPTAGLITFSEYALGTMNPVYAPMNYGGGPNAPTVTFGGYFKGQTPGAANPGACPSGAVTTGCVLGKPTGPLSLDPNSPQTFIAGDGSMPTAPILSGSPQYNGSIAILFSKPQVGVGLDGGYFDAVGSTAITAFGADGHTIGSVTNSTTGDEFLGLVTASGQATISGLEFSLVGDEPAGFDVDNIRFGEAGQVTVPGGPPVTAVTPEPSSLVMLATGLAGLVPAVRSRFRRMA